MKHSEENSSPVLDYPIALFHYNAQIIDISSAVTAICSSVKFGPSDYSRNFNRRKKKTYTVRVISSCHLQSLLLFPFSLVHTPIEQERHHGDEKSNTTLNANPVGATRVATSPIREYFPQTDRRSRLESIEVHKVGIR